MHRHFSHCNLVGPICAACLCCPREVSLIIVEGACGGRYQNVVSWIRNSTMIEVKHGYVV